MTGRFPLRILYPEEVVLQFSTGSRRLCFLALREGDSVEPDDYWGNSFYFSGTPVFGIINGAMIVKRSDPEFGGLDLTKTPFKEGSEIWAHLDGLLAEGDTAAESLVALDIAAMTPPWHQPLVQEVVEYTAESGSIRTCLPIPIAWSWLAKTLPAFGDSPPSGRYLLEWQVCRDWAAGSWTLHHVCRRMGDEEELERKFSAASGWEKDVEQVLVGSQSDDEVKQ